MAFDLPLARPFPQAPGQECERRGRRILHSASSRGQARALVVDVEGTLERARRRGGKASALRFGRRRLRGRDRTLRHRAAVSEQHRNKQATR